jgi:hypothetical protein
MDAHAYRSESCLRGGPEVVMTIRTLRLAAPLLLLGLAVPALASGQDFGIKAGANSATLTIAPANPAVSIGSRTGFVGGVYGTRRFSSVLGLETDVLFAAKGAKSKSDSGSSFSFNYLTVPILARLKISGSSTVRVHLVGGPEFGYRIHAKLVNGGDSIAYDQFVKVYDLGGAVGGNAEFGRFGIDVRYTRGLVDISKAIAGELVHEKITNRTVTALFGVTWKSS